MKKQIIWEPWIDPFQPPDDEIGYRDEDDKTPYEQATEEKQEHPYKPIAIISSPTLGVVPVMPHAIPSKSFNFWVGHTNFSITEAEKNILEDADGVETLDIISRYRFRVGIGKVFDPAQVKNNIQNILCQDLDSEYIDADILQNVNDLKSKLETNNKFWFIFVAPNGQMDYAVSEELNEEFQNTVAVYENTANEINGKLITSWK